VGWYRIVFHWNSPNGDWYDPTLWPFRPVGSSNRCTAPKSGGTPAEPAPAPSRPTPPAPSAPGAPTAPKPYDAATGIITFGSGSLAGQHSKLLKPGKFGLASSPTKQFYTVCNLKR
jgi:hypothetical protein